MKLLIIALLLARVGHATEPSEQNQCDEIGRKVGAYHAYPTVIDNGYTFACIVIPKAPQRRPHVENPKFRVGDCVTTYGFEPFKIYEILTDERLPADMYGVVLDASCKEKDRVMCNSSSVVYDVDVVDREGKKVPCP